MQATPAKLILAGALASVSLVGFSVAGASVTARTAPAPCAKAWVTNSHAPITLNFWESMPKGALGGDGNYGVLHDAVAAFNVAHAGKIVVNDVNQAGGYSQTWNDYTAAIQAHSGVPNVIMFDQHNAQSAADTGTVLPVSTCISANKFNKAPFLAKVFGAYTNAKTTYGMPFSASVPVMYYNKQAFAQAHITTPPNTMAKLIADQKLLQKVNWSCTKCSPHTAGKYTYGVSIKYDPWEVTSWLGLDNHSVVNNSNGHTKRASAMSINTTNARAYLTALQQIAKNAGGANVYNPGASSINSAYGNLFDVTSGKAGITFDTTAAFGEIQNSLGLYKNVTLGVAPLPTLTGKSVGGMPPGGNGLFINKSNSSSAQQAASWVFIQYLTSVANLVKWDKGTGYLPIRTDEVAPWKAALSTSQKLWYGVGYASLSAGKVDFSTEGPLLGPNTQVNNDISSALQALLTSPFSTSPASALTIATTNANADITMYNAVVP